MIGATFDRIKAELHNDKLARDALREDNKHLDSEVRKLEREWHRLQKEDPSSQKAQHSSSTSFILSEVRHNKKTKAKAKGVALEIPDDKIAHLDCEGYRLYMEELKHKENLKRAIAVDRERLRILRDSRTDITEMNLDHLTQPELIRIVKQLERRKVDLQSKLRETENSLDTTAKDVAKLLDTQKMYQTEFDLRERKRGGTRMQKI